MSCMSLYQGTTSAHIIHYGNNFGSLFFHFEDNFGSTITT